MSDHPEWLTEILHALKRLWPLDRQLNVVMQDALFFEYNGYPDAHGFCQVQEDLITIHIRRDAGDEEYLSGVFFHEYCHAALAPLLRDFDWAKRDAAEHVSIVEAFTERFGGLLLYAHKTGAVPVHDPAARG